MASRTILAAQLKQVVSPLVRSESRMENHKQQVFLSYSGEDAFEASLLQYAVETMLADLDATVWTYQRDQSSDQKGIAANLKRRVQKSKATIFLVSPHTLDSGATQWMELAYSDAFKIPTFVLLHHLSFQQLKAKEKGVPPLLLESQCNSAVDWKNIVASLRKRLKRKLNTHI